MFHICLFIGEIEAKQHFRQSHAPVPDELIWNNSQVVEGKHRVFKLKRWALEGQTEPYHVADTCADEVNSWIGCKCSL